MVKQCRSSFDPWSVAVELNELSRDAVVRFIELSRDVVVEIIEWSSRELNTMKELRRVVKASFGWEVIGESVGCDWKVNSRGRMSFE